MTLRLCAPADGDELCFGASTRKYIVKGLPEPKPAPTSSPAAAAAPAAESAGDMQPPGQDLRASLPAAFGRKGESAVDAADDEGQADSGSASVLDSFAMKQPAPAATGISFGQISRPAGRTAASAEPGAAEPAKKSVRQWAESVRLRICPLTRKRGPTQRAEVEEAIRSMQEDPGEASRAVVQRAREAGALREGGKGRRGDGGAVEEEGDEDEDDEEDEDEEEGGDGGGARVQSVAESLRLPISHEALLSGHRKVRLPAPTPTSACSALTQRACAVDGDVRGGGPRWFPCGDRLLRLRRQAVGLWRDGPVAPGVSLLRAA